MYVCMQVRGAGCVFWGYMFVHTYVHVHYIHTGCLMQAMGRCISDSRPDHVRVSSYFLLLHDALSSLPPRQPCCIHILTLLQDREGKGEIVTSPESLRLLRRPRKDRISWPIHPFPATYGRLTALVTAA